MNRISARLNLVGRGALLALGCGFMVNVAQAQATSSDPDTIVVDGERLSEAAVRDRAEQFIRATRVAAGETPAARWVDPICPDVVGIAENAAQAAEAKIRRIAAAVGAEVAPESCERNIVISFAPDPAALARQIEEQAPTRLSELSPTSREAVLRGTAPIRWWYSTEVRGRHGESAGVGGAGATQGRPGPGSGAGSGIPGGGGLMHYDSSVISTLSTRVLTSAIVIVDENAVVGRRLDTVAAYAALVALAEIRDIDAAPAGSILGMFASPSSARDLTAQDRAFLRALYDLPLDRQAMRHRGTLVQGIAQNLRTGDR